MIIDKLPFASPATRSPPRASKSHGAGGEAFNEYQVPLAILTLLQGLGRLIRHAPTGACWPCSTRGCGRWDTAGGSCSRSAGADRAGSGAIKRFFAG